LRRRLGERQGETEVNTTEQTRLAHVVATVDTTVPSGKILYVNPSSIRSSKDPLQGLGRGDVALVLRDASGGEIARIYPEIRYDACAVQDLERPGLIQQDVEVPAGLAGIELVQGDVVLDTFQPAADVPAPEVAGGMTLSRSLSGDDTRSGFSASVAPQEGVTYMVEARPDNSRYWNTLSIGRKTPAFEIDKNQFPGATTLKVRVIQNVGFRRRVFDERDIPLQ
jgi:hypothetical protein